MICLAVHGLEQKDPKDVLSSTDTRLGVQAHAYLATDGDWATCARSGFSRGSWFKTRLDTPRKIKHVDLYGKS